MPLRLLARRGRRLLEANHPGRSCHRRLGTRPQDWWSWGRAFASRRDATNCLKSAEFSLNRRIKGKSRPEISHCASANRRCRICRSRGRSCDIPKLFSASAFRPRAGVVSANRRRTPYREPKRYGGSGSLGLDRWLLPGASYRPLWPSPAHIRVDRTASDFRCNVGM
jgi:hypothetical protein